MRGRLPGAIGADDIAWPRAAGDPFRMALIRESAVARALLLKNAFTSHPAMTAVLVGGFALGVGSPLVVCVRRSSVPLK